MNLLKILTPKNTEEIKPGLFIQKTERGYKQVYPAAWNGKIDYKNLIFGKGFLKTTLFFLALLFIVYGYSSTTNACMKFQEKPCDYLNNLTQFCMEVEENNKTWNWGMELINGEEENNYTLQSNP